MAFIIVNTVKEVPLNAQRSRLVNTDEIRDAIQEYHVNGELSDSDEDGAEPCVQIFLKYSTAAMVMIDPKYKLADGEVTNYPEKRPSEIFVSGTLQQFVSSLVKATGQCCTSGDGARLAKYRIKTTGLEGTTIQADELIGAEPFAVFIDNLLYWDFPAGADFQEVNFNPVTGELELGGDDGLGGPVFGPDIKTDFWYWPAVSSNILTVDTATDVDVPIPGGRVIDSILVTPEFALTALNIGTTPGGTEIVGPEDVSIPNGAIYVVNWITGAGLTLHFTGITSQTRIKIQFKL